MAQLLKPVKYGCALEIIQHFFNFLQCTFQLRIRS